MGKDAFITEPRKVEIRDCEVGVISENEVKIKTLFTGFSSGTEMSVYRGTAPFYRKRFDSDLHLFLESNEVWNYPICYGYINVGEVIELGSKVTSLQKEDIVFSYQPHQTESIVKASDATKLPKDIEPILGIFIANINTTFNGILDSRINLGETVTIFGCGLLGQLLIQQAKLSGAGQIIAIDMLDKRLDIASRSGADITLNPTKEKDIALEIRGLTNNIGSDVVIDVSGSDKALHEAIRTAAFQGTVVAMSWYQGGASSLFLGDEFHHNRVTIRCSQAGSIDPTLSHRWNNQRRINTVLKLLKILKLRELISHRFDFSKITSAYELIDQHPEEVLQVIVEYS